MSWFCKTLIWILCLCIGLFNVLCNEICEPRAVKDSLMICPNTCTTCIMNCTNKQSCIQSIMISGALNTQIYCDGSQSCKKSVLNIGTNDILSPYYQTQYNSLYISCTNDNSCAEFNVNITGNFIINGNIETNISSIYGSNQTKNGQIHVQLNEEQLYVLNCDTISCNQLKVICYSGNCICNGDCSSMINGGIIQPITITSTSPTTILSTETPSIMPSITPNEISSGLPTMYIYPNISNTTYPSPSIIPTYNPTYNPTKLFINPTKYEYNTTTSPTFITKKQKETMFIKKYLKTIIGLGLSVVCCFTLSRILCKRMLKFEEYKNAGNTYDSDSEDIIENRKHPNYFESSVQDSFMEDQVNEMTTTLKTYNESREYAVCDSQSDLNIPDNNSSDNIIASQTLIKRG